jgi:CRISPR/Cas system CMR-associated protein Cmr3 (group 5 of RAMP superfamily)
MLRNKPKIVSFVEKYFCIIYVNYCNKKKSWRNAVTLFRVLGPFMFDFPGGLAVRVGVGASVAQRSSKVLRVLQCDLGRDARDSMR